MGQISQPTRIWLPRTGQTVGYPNGDGADRDDGHYQAGNPRATRYVALGNGCVYDRATDLTWVADPSQIGDPFGTPAAPATMAWLDAIAACEGLSYGGFSDWRLPNVRELGSIIDLSRCLPALRSAFFPNTPSAFYWTSTTYAGGSASAHVITFSSGASSFGTKAGGAYYVRPVRGGRVHG